MFGLDVLHQAVELLEKYDEVSKVKQALRVRLNLDGVKIRKIIEKRKPQYVLPKLKKE